MGANIDVIGSGIIHFTPILTFPVKGEGTISQLRVERETAMHPLLVVLIVALIAYAVFAAYRTHITVQRRRREEEDKEWPDRRRLP